MIKPCEAGNITWKEQPPHCGHHPGLACLGWQWEFRRLGIGSNASIRIWSRGLWGQSRWRHKHPNSQSFLAVVKLSHSTLYWLQVPPITLLAVAALAPSFVITVSHIQPLRRWCAGCAETGCSLENDWWQSIGLLQWLSYTSVLCSAQNVIRPWFGWCPDLGPQAQPQDENCNLAQTCLLLCYILFWNLFDPNTYSITQ